MEQFLIGAALMTISALTFVAYRHPKVYEEVLFNKLYLGSLVVFLAFASWHISNRAALSAVEKYVPPESLDKAKEAVGSLTAPIALVMLGFLAVAVYLMALSWLARHFEKEHQREREKR